MCSFAPAWLRFFFVIVLEFWVSGSSDGGVGWFCVVGCFFGFGTLCSWICVSHTLWSFCGCVWCGLRLAGDYSAYLLMFR